MNSKAVTLILVAAIVSCATCQDIQVDYKLQSVAKAESGICSSTEENRKRIGQDIDLLINSTILPALRQQSGPEVEHTPSHGHGACGCGGPGWRRIAYLNMSDPTQTCPQAWELITTPRRSCSRPSNAGSNSCYPALYFPQGGQYSQVCGRIIGYQKGQPGAFLLENLNRSQSIDGTYVDGVSLTYGAPRQHIWTFANALDEFPHINLYTSKCPCTNVTEIRPISVPTYIGNDYFCETGVPPGVSWRDSMFYADDPLWDGQGCGPLSTCCTFNNPPWFCRQLPQSTDAFLEIRLCSVNPADYENTPIELIDIYVK